MSADPSNLFTLGAAEILIILLLIVVGIMWRRMESNASMLHERISEVKGTLIDHRVECAESKGEMSARLSGLETQVDRYTDARFEALEAKTAT